MMMMQPELLLQTSWPIQSYFHSNLDDYESEHHEFLSSINTTPENSFMGYDQMQNPSPVDSNSQNINILDDVCRWLCDDDQETDEIQSIKGDDVSSVTIDDVMEESNDTIEPESQTVLQNLLKAYADAMTTQQSELANVIVKCVSEMINPIGLAIERIAFNLFQCAENQEEEYLKQESMRNFMIAFRAFYDILPYAKFAHFVANSTILEAVPMHVESVHVVDFDIGEGSQWPVVIEAISQQRKSLTITSVKLEEHEEKFEETKRQLSDHARNFGLNLKVQEIELGQLGKIMGGTKLGKEFLAFNCQVDLPHMVTTRKPTLVMDFLKVAKAVLEENEGIITYGDGEEGERMKNSSNYTSFFDKNLAHYKALYESMEFGFPSYLTEARIAMETLFISPFINSKSWFQKWEERAENTGFQKDLGLKGKKISEESLNEARELVKEGETPYGIRIKGENGNEMVLEWKGIPLVKVSAWV